MDHPSFTLMCCFQGEEKNKNKHGTLKIKRGKGKLKIRWLGTSAIHK